MLHRCLGKKLSAPPENWCNLTMNANAVQQEQAIHFFLCNKDIINYSEEIFLKPSIYTSKCQDYHVTLGGHNQLILCSDQEPSHIKNSTSWLKNVHQTANSHDSWHSMGTSSKLLSYVNLWKELSYSDSFRAIWNAEFNPHRTWIPLLVQTQHMTYCLSWGWINEVGPIAFRTNRIANLLGTINELKENKRKEGYQMRFSLHTHTHQNTYKMFWKWTSTDFFWSLLINEKFTIPSIKMLIISRGLKLMSYIRLLQSYEILSVPCASR